jgi:alkane 1-monooxygenase
MKLILRRIGFFTSFIIPTLAITGFYLGGSWNYLTVFFSFILIPIVDQALGLDKSNVSEQHLKAEAEEFFYRFVTYCWTYFQLAFIIWGCFAVTSGKLQGTSAWIGFIVSFSLVTGGIGITVAHELGHKKSKLERFYCKAILMTVCYMHFYIEHNRGHHVYVATPADPATSRKNENAYNFWIRSVTNSYVHAWRLENDSMKRTNKPFIANEMLWFTILPFIFCGVLTIVFSLIEKHIAWEIPVFFFSQSFLAFTLLELINYVEHYGIARREISPGRFERVNPLHSWNASHLLSNFFLFQLQRHSDHHASAHKRYQVLNHYDESPQLPFGYPTMIILALIPPLWFRIMNKRLEVWQEVAGLQVAEA